MKNYFKDQVQQRFSTLSSDQDYFIYDLVKQTENDAPLTTTMDQHSTKVVHRLILVATTTTTGQHEEDKNKQLISGLEVYEYTTHSHNDQPRRTIYISKIDTTGSTLAKGVTRRLVQAYVASQQQLGGKCSIHVFARAQPQYLFPQSAKDTSKHILTDRQLVAWWRTTLGAKDIYSMDSSNGKVVPYWIVPGVEEQDALYDIGQKQILPGKSITWRYGYPYAGDALAKHVIPRFEDDGKARYLRTLMDSTEDDDQQQKLTVDEFWTLLGYSEECGSNKVVAFFVVEISGLTQTQDSTTTEPVAPLNDDEYTLIWNFLMSQDFCDEESNVKSTSKWLQTWADTLSPRSFAITTNHNNGSSGSGNNNNNFHITSDTSQPIQMLAVKRKPISSPAPASIALIDTSEAKPQSTANSLSAATAATTTATTTEATEKINVLVPKRRKKEN